jgi:diacylglycerol kinase family enzyme
MSGVIFFNPAAGNGSVEEDDLREHFSGHRVEACEPDDIGDQITEALAGRPQFIGVSGGDGTIRAAAEAMGGTGVPLLVIPSGTRNHFAKELGIVDLDAAVAAIGGTTRDVDLGGVNGRCFVNNSSLGLYPKIVVRREAHERRLPKGIANIVATYEQLRHGRRMRVRFDGDEHDAWMVFVGNGRYGESLLALMSREALDDHILDIRLVRADRPLARLRVLLAILLGRLARSPLVERRDGTSMVLDVDRPAVEVALDGEVTRLEPPLRYEVMPGALTVLVAPDEPDQ